MATHVFAEVADDLLSFKLRKRVVPAQPGKVASAVMNRAKAEILMRVSQ